MENFDLKKNENGKIANEMEEANKNAHHLDCSGKKEIPFLNGLNDSK